MTSSPATDDLRILNIVDDVTPGMLGGDPRYLDLEAARGGAGGCLDRAPRQPSMIVSDNGTEFTSNAMLAWAQDNRIDGISLRQESRCRTASVSFNYRMRDELESLFLDLDHARSRIANWIDDYNQRRTRRWATSRRRLTPPISPQRAIGCATPTSLADRASLHPRPTA